jgi:hypothetical protein
MGLYLEISNNYLVYIEFPIKDSLMHTLFSTTEYFNSKAMGQYFSEAYTFAIYYTVSSKYIFHEMRF